MSKRTEQLTCFVIIGYGVKTDYRTGREIDLDKTYRNIIEPTFKDLGFLCFRACDIQHAGVIDVPMYDGILKADFVVADLTTWNPNVLYELGVRHAVKKNSTIIISDRQPSYPFDLNHIVIEAYEHLGKGIEFEEVMRFREVLKEKVKKLLVEHPLHSDSPLYVVFPSLSTPSFTSTEIREIRENMDQGLSLTDLVGRAEVAKDNGNFLGAIELLNLALKYNPGDQFLVQRLALSTYKSKQPTPIKALEDSEKILSMLNPETTTDIETLGLVGAINKRFYEATGDLQKLKKSLGFYERGFYLANDYYNGINAAYINTILASISDDKFDAYAKFGNANAIRIKVIEIGERLQNSKIWDERDDKQWIFLSIAEAYFGLGDMENVEKYVEKAKPFIKGTFSLNTFLEQQAKLKAAIDIFKAKYGIG